MSKLFGSFKSKMSQKKSGTDAGSGAYPGPADDPPPAYTATPSGYTGKEPSGRPAGHGLRITNSGVTNDADRYAFLGSFDTVFVVDDSGSMVGRNWREARLVLSQITGVCTARDADGIDLYFLNHRSDTHPDGGYHGLTDPAAVEHIFDAVAPQSVTMTGKRLRRILRPYLDTLERAQAAAARAAAQGRPDQDEDGMGVDSVKPVNIIVITDGAPSDDPESVIVQAARHLDRLDAPLYQVGIQFFQVGNFPDAREALQHLDDNLAELGVRDMVDTATFDQGGVLTADGILKVVLGAVVRRLDRQKGAPQQERRRR